MLGLLFRDARTKTAVESFDPTRCIDGFLLTGIKRMAGRTNVDLDVFGQGRARINDIAAAACGGYRLVVRMNVGFHCRSWLDLRAAHSTKSSRSRNVPASKDESGQNDDG